MKAIECYPRNPLQLIEKPLPELPRNGVLVKVSFAGVCHSDVHLWEGFIDTGHETPLRTEDVAKVPVTLGHEISGVVSQINESRDEAEIDIAVGDNVLVFTCIGCGDCYHCKHGQENICMQKQRRVGINLDGGYAEYVMVPHYSYCIKVPTEIPMATAALLSCSGLTAYNALSIAVPFAKESASMKGAVGLVIVGTGGLGTWAIKMAKAMMPEGTKVVAADISEERILAAKQSGADEGVIWKDVPSPEVAGQTVAACGGTVDIIIDFVNSSKTHSQPPLMLRSGGLIVPVGMFGGKSSLPLPLIALLQWRVIGAMMGNLAQIKELVKLLQDHTIAYPNLEFYNLEQAQETLEKLRDGKIKGRALIKF